MFVLVWLFVAVMLACCYVLVVVGVLWFRWFAYCFVVGLILVIFAFDLECLFGCGRSAWFIGLLYCSCLLMLCAALWF